MDDWKEVIWSDKAQINHLGSDGYIYAWKRSEKGLNDRLIWGTIMFSGGFVKLWDCIKFSMLLVLMVG